MKYKAIYFSAYDLQLARVLLHTGAGENAVLLTY